MNIHRVEATSTFDVANGELVMTTNTHCFTIENGYERCNTFPTRCVLYPDQLIELMGPEILTFLAINASDLVVGIREALLRDIAADIPEYVAQAAMEIETDDPQDEP